MQLVLGDYIKKNPDLSATMSQAADVVSWFNAHSFALHLLYAEQRACEFIIVLALIRAVITRWGTHVTSFKRLLKVCVPLRAVVLKKRSQIRDSAGPKREQKAKADSIMAIIESRPFWEKLEK